jgi:putative ABC transport system permease protein
MEVRDHDLVNGARVLILLLFLLLALPGAAPPQVGPADANLPEVLLSRQVMGARGLAPGDIVLLSGDPSGAGARRFRVAARYEPMPDPIRLTSERFEARFHLPDLLALTAGTDDRESVSSINVKLADPGDADAFARDLSGRVPLLSVRPARGGEEGNPFVVLGRFHLAIAVLTVTTSAVFLLALMVLLADERRVAVGTLRLIGLTRGRVLAQVLVEGALIAVVGATFGVALAAAAQGAFNRYFQWRYDTSLVFVRITPAIVWQSVALAIPLGIAASGAASWGLVRSEILKLVRR